MLDSRFHNPPNAISYRISIITLDSHNAMPCERALSNLVQDFKGLKMRIPGLHGRRGIGILDPENTRS